MGINYILGCISKKKLQNSAKTFICEYYTTLLAKERVKKSNNSRCKNMCSKDNSKILLIRVLLTAKGKCLLVNLLEVGIFTTIFR